jgi:hypothetical protein
MAWPHAYVAEKDHVIRLELERAMAKWIKATTHIARKA